MVDVATFSRDLAVARPDGLPLNESACPPRCHPAPAVAGPNRRRRWSPSSCRAGGSPAGRRSRQAPITALIAMKCEKITVSPTQPCTKSTIRPDTRCSEDPGRPRCPASPIATSRPGRPSRSLRRRDLRHGRFDRDRVCSSICVEPCRRSTPQQRTRDHRQRADGGQLVADPGCLLATDVVEIRVGIDVPAGGGAAMAHETNDGAHSNSHPIRNPGGCPCSMNHSCPNAWANTSAASARRSSNRIPGCDERRSQPACGRCRRRHRPRA